MPEPTPPAPRASHEFGPFDGQVRGHIPQGPDRNAEGHYIPGPVRRTSGVVRMIPDATDAPPAPAPHVARVQMRARIAEKRRIADRHVRFLAAVRGEPVGRNRAA